MSEEISKINAYQFSFDDIDNQKIDLSQFKDKVLLIVNTASSCGFTPQYRDLENLYQKYKDQGFEIIAVPSRDFGGQEFKQESETKEFVEEKFSVSFKLTSINKVSGSNAHPFYLWANKQSGIFGSPKWNFHKYIIDKNGNLVTWFSSPTSPMSDKVTKIIEKELKK